MQNANGNGVAAADDPVVCDNTSTVYSTYLEPLFIQYDGVTH